jgi:hypothetical protein
VARSPDSIAAWLRNLLGRITGASHGKTRGPAAPGLSGAPKRLRLKTYSSESGPVYQYVYRGHRSSDDATEHIFSITMNRKDWTAIGVRLERRTIDQWRQLHGRELRPIDLYAIAKRSLFEEFDRAEGDQLSTLIQPAPDDITRHLTALGLL